LLDIAWRSPTQALPNDDRRLAQMLGITRARWLKIRPQVMAFWFLSERGWQQKRLLKEWKNAQERRNKRRDAANARWAAKSLETNKSGDAKAYANGYATADANADATKTISITKEEETPNGVAVSDRIDPQEIVDAWNITADRYGLPKVAKLTDRRRQQLKARIRENTLEDFQKVFAAIGRSPFLRGENKNGWRADFDFVLQPKSFVRMLEGSYDH
jgi:uncharacterized protein YdaU (DUF1376 family)